MTRFYLRLEVKGDYDDHKVTHTTVSLKEILEENETELAGLGYLTPKVIELSKRLDEKAGAVIPSKELLCGYIPYVQKLETHNIRLVANNDYGIFIKVDPLDVLEGDNLKSYKEKVAQIERATKAAEAKKNANAKAKEARKLAAAKKLLESKGLKVNG